MARKESDAERAAATIRRIEAVRNRQGPRGRATGKSAITPRSPWGPSLSRRNTIRSNRDARVMSRGRSVQDAFNTANSTAMDAFRDPNGAIDVGRWNRARKDALWRSAREDPRTGRAPGSSSITVNGQTFTGRANMGAAMQAAENLGVRSRAAQALRGHLTTLGFAGKDIDSIIAGEASGKGIDWAGISSKANKMMADRRAAHNERWKAINDGLPATESWDDVKERSLLKRATAMQQIRKASGVPEAAAGAAGAGAGAGAGADVSVTGAMRTSSPREIYMRTSGWTSGPRIDWRTKTTVRGGGGVGGFGAEGRGSIVGMGAEERSPISGMTSAERSDAFWAKIHDSQERAKWYASAEGQKNWQNQRLRDAYARLEAQETNRLTDGVRSLMALDKLKSQYESAPVVAGANESYPSVPGLDAPQAAFTTGAPKPNPVALPTNGGTPSPKPVELPSSGGASEPPPQEDYTGPDAEGARAAEVALGLNPTYQVGDEKYKLR